MDPVPVRLSICPGKTALPGAKIIFCSEQYHFSAHSYIIAPSSKKDRRNRALQRMPPPRFLTDSESWTTASTAGPDCKEYKQKGPRLRGPFLWPTVLQTICATPPETAPTLETYPRFMCINLWISHFHPTQVPSPPALPINRTKFRQPCVPENHLRGLLAIASRKACASVAAAGLSTRPFKVIKPMARLRTGLVTGRATMPL